MSEHHGDGYVGYFYTVAKKTGNINEEDFKYRGKKPQTKEAGVLMLAGYCGCCC